MSARGASAASPPASTTTTVADAPVQVAHTNLGNVAYRVVGRGPNLVLIMGYAGTMQTWDPHFVDTLALHFRVITFDNAGIGKTATVRAPLSIDAMADQTSALITTLHLGKPDVLGWSMGTMIAESLAIRHSGQVHRLVLCAAYPGVGNAVQPSQKDVDALTGSNPAAAQADLFPSDQNMAADAFDGSLSAYQSSKSAPTSVTTAQKNAIIAWFDGRDSSGRRANRISVPTLIADGVSDRIDAASNDREVAAQIAHSHLLLYPDAGHAFLFQEGDLFAFKVRTFLTSQPKALDKSQIRRGFLDGYKALTAAGNKWVAGLKKLNTSSSARDLAQLDLRQSDAEAAFDDELLGFGATASLAPSIRVFTNADELVARDILAFGAQSGSKAKKWTSIITADGKVVQATENALRRELGLSPIPTTTTTVAKH